MKERPYRKVVSHRLSERGGTIDILICGHELPHRAFERRRCPICPPDPEEAPPPKPEPVYEAIWDETKVVGKSVMLRALRFDIEKRVVYMQIVDDPGTVVPFSLADGSELRFAPAMILTADALYRARKAARATLDQGERRSSRWGARYGRSRDATTRHQVSKRKASR